jgi:RimJ/RimL family protein N-acetyltransferase
MTVTTRPTLIDCNLHLPAPKDADAAARLELDNSREIQAMSGGSPDQFGPISQTQADGWLTAQQQHKLALIIECKGALTGALRLRSINQQDQRGRYAIAILDPNRLGQGIGKRATRLIMGYAFGELGLHRLTVRVLAFNERAIACSRKAGSINEGREREAAYIGGKRYDDVMMGALDPEWRRSA